jgi:hypothetical protein
MFFKRLFPRRYTARPVRAEPPPMPRIRYP